MADERATYLSASGSYIAQATEGSIANVTVYQYALARLVDPAMLEVAQHRLAALPLDTIPDPAPLPSPHRMPLSRNPIFVGRTDDLHALAKVLKGDETASIGYVAAVTGLGGIGKTQLASEFVHRYGQYFQGGVFWLSFANPVAVPTEVASCGGSGGLDIRPDFTSLSIDDQIALVQAAWQSPLPRLLVFDNCEDEALLQQWRPTSGGTRVLVTSRRAQWDTTLGVYALPLGVFKRQESIALLREHRPDLSADDVEIDEIARELGDLPLALHLAGSFLATYRHVIAPATYLEQLHTLAILEHRSLKGSGVSPTKHAQNMARTFALSYERLDTADLTDRMALDLLARAGYFASDELIPRTLLLNTLDLVEDDSDALLQVEDALARLVNLGLLQRGGDDTLRLHRLLTAFVLGVSADATVQEEVEKVILAAANYFLTEGDLGVLHILQPHLYHVTEMAQEREDELTVGLSTALGNYLLGIGYYDEAQSILERALTIINNIYSEDHPSAATVLSHLGTISQTKGEFYAARSYFHRSLSVSERTQGKDHLSTVAVINYLGQLLQAQGKYLAARSHFKRALTIAEQAPEQNHRIIAMILNNLGQIFQLQGEYHEAKGYFERALITQEQVLEEDHIDTATSFTNLGNILRVQGDYSRAQAYIEKALTIYEQVLDDNHPLIAISLTCLGLVFQAQGDHRRAQSYFERALKVCKKVLGEMHPTTATILNNLGGVLQAQGQYSAARSYYERALSISQQVLGKNHPGNVLLLNNLGLLLALQGQYVAAKPYFEQALMILESVVGEHHSDIALVLNNIGLLLHAQGQYFAAKPYLERALKIYEQVFGENHPDTARCLNNLGLLLRQQADYTGAQLYYERALKIYEQVFGENHHDIATTLNNLGALFQTQGNNVGAQSYLERAWRICREVLGEEHPESISALSNLAYALYENNDYAKAQLYFEQTLTVRERVLGENHPDVAVSLNNLADLLQTQDQYSEAKSYYERALAIREQVLGEDHPDTAISLSKLGDLLTEQGEYVAAQSYHERALAIRQRLLGDDHPYTARSLNGLGELAQAKGDYVKAERYYERALAILKQRLGGRHPITRMVRDNLKRNKRDRKEYPAVIISFPHWEGAIEKVSYEIDNGILNLVIIMGDSGMLFNESDIVFNENGDFPVLDEEKLSVMTQIKPNDVRRLILSTPCKELVEVSYEVSGNYLHIIIKGRKATSILHNKMVFTRSSEDVSDEE